MSSARSQRDPIEHVRKLLIDEAGVEKEELKKIEKVMFVDAGHLQACRGLHLLQMLVSCVLSCHPQT